MLQGDLPTLDLLLPSADLLQCNARGHNALHLAAVRGDAGAIQRLLARDRAMVNLVSRLAGCRAAALCTAGQRGGGGGAPPGR